MSKILWRPSPERINQSNMYRFIQFVNTRHKLALADYDQLYHWSVANIADFWSAMWEFADIRCSTPFDWVADDLKKMPGTRWFEGAKLNFAENLLRYRDDRIALVFKGETRPTVRLTYAELYDAVARVAVSLKAMGITQGDRVAGFIPNMPQATIAMLAATSLGATWSSCSPDFGIKGVMDRFGQIAPKVLLPQTVTSSRARPWTALIASAGLSLRSHPLSAWWWSRTPRTIPIFPASKTPYCLMLSSQRRQI